MRSLQKRYGVFHSNKHMFKRKVFLILWLAGMAGVFSFLLVDLQALIAHFPIPEGTEKPVITPLFKLLSLAQPAVLLSIAVLTGVAFASRVGLSSPVAEALAKGERAGSAFIPQFVPGIIGGVAGGVSVVVIATMWKPFLPSEVLARAAELGNLLPLPTRLLYGGITEELLLRWGLMTLLVWVPWKLIQKGKDKPKRVYFIGAILISSLVFAAGHLPVAYVFFPELSFALTTYVIVGNSAFGFIAGYLYWKIGLESAIIAHMVTHVVMWVATFMGMYF